MINMQMQRRFYSLLNRYEKDTAFKSFNDYDHPSYKEIILMDKSVIYLLLANLNNSWLPMMVLREIVGKDAIKVEPSDVGVFDKLCEKWLAWGNKEGYIK